MIAAKSPAPECGRYDSKFKIMPQSKQIENNNHHYSIGDELYKEGKYRKALLEFEKALSATPTDCDTNWAIASCYSELGKADLAEKYYKKALESCNENQKHDLSYNIGNALFDQLKFIDSIQYYEGIPKTSSVYTKAKRNIKVAKRKIDRY